MVTEHEWTQSVYRAVDLLVRSRILVGAPVSSRPVFEPRKRAPSPQLAAGLGSVSENG
jgi:hypothetical protein